jgi:DNA-binding response OmpR family regulator
MVVFGTMLQYTLPRVPFWAGDSTMVWGSMSQQKSVLVIDDDLALSRLVALVLRRSGYLVDVANGGEEGLQLALANRYDGIILDLRMPGKDGRTVFREIRAGGVAAPVMILSAYDARRAREELGSEAYMNKPFDPELLVEGLAAMLDSQREARRR